MTHSENEEDANTGTVSQIDLPAEPVLTSAELAHRRQLYAEAQTLREEIGSIDMRTDELIRQVREEADAGCGG